MEQNLLNILKDFKDSGMSKYEALEHIKRIKGERLGNTFAEAQNQPLMRSFKYDEPYLRDHTVFGEQVLLGVTHCSMAIDALSRVRGKPDARINKLLFVNPVVVSDGEAVELTVTVRENNNRLYFTGRCKKTPGLESFEAASGEYIIESAVVPGTLELESIKEKSVRVLTGGEIYKSMENSPIVHGPSLKTLKKVYVNGLESLGELELTEEILKNSYSYEAHPALLDGALVSILPILADEVEGTFLPLMVKDVYIYGSLPPQCMSYTRIEKINSDIVVANIDICSLKGQILLKLNGFTFKKVDSKGDFGRQVVETVSSNSHDILQKDHHAAGKGNFSAFENISIEKEIESYLTGKVQSILETGSIDKEKNFMDMGVDSTSLISMAGDIEKELNLELYPTLFFEYQNIRELAGFFLNEHSDKIRLHFNKKTGKPAKSALSDKEAENLTSGESTGTIKEGYKKTEGNTNPKITEFTDYPGHKKTRDDGNDRIDIAVIGMAGIFADSPDVESFWENLRSGKDSIREIPSDHFDYQNWFDPNPMAADKMYSKWGSFVDDVGKFDSGFFNISPREAALMDPQLRKLLQVIYSTAEDAGYASRLSGTKTGMYVGGCFHDYNSEMSSHMTTVDPHSGTGNAATMLANRPSFYFNLYGPSLAVDTACSSSLVALHLAYKALKQNECEMAFAAGTNLLLSPSHYKYFCSIGALSPTGRCHTFDSRADGYVPGEAVAAVLLKPLKKALADGDNIHAVIKGSAINHGGYTPSVTAPSVKQEAQVILDAWKDAGIDPRTIGYIEAHGTGTKLGDPIEINALRMVFKDHQDVKPYCAIGSAKAHIGHAEGAAGITGVIKAILSLKKGEIPVMPKFEELNPYIKLEGSPIYINRRVEEWKPFNGQPRRAGVSSFGFGGSYAHVVVEEFKSDGYSGKPENETPEIFVFSARSRERLKKHVENVKAFIEKNRPGASMLADIAYTLQIGRQPMEERLAVVAASSEELIEALQRFIFGNMSGERIYYGSPGKANMGAEILSNDDDAGEMILKWFQKGKLDKLAQLWVNGMQLTWPRVTAGKSRQIVSLPTYPFEGEFYWFTDLDNTGRQKAVTPTAVPGLSKSEKALMDIIQKNTPVETGSIEIGLSWDQLEADSITAMKTVHEILKVFGLQEREGEGALLLEYVTRNNPSIKELAEYIDEKTGKDVGEPEKKHSNHNSGEHGTELPDSEGTVLSEENGFDSLCKIIADNTGLAIKDLRPDQPLDELSTDSVINLKIARDILNEFSYINIQNDAGNRLVEYLIGHSSTVGGLLEFINELESEGERKAKAHLDIQEISRAQKNSNQNIIIQSVQADENSPCNFSGKLTIDETHPFFFDHELDHVSGMQLLEGMSQVCRTGFLYDKGGKPSGSLFIPEITVSYHGYCSKEEDSWVKAALHKKDRFGYHYSTQVVQNNKTVASGKFVIRENKFEYKNSESKVSNHIGNIEPCSRLIVNKQNPLNILISDIINMGSDIGCYLIFQQDNPYFNDFAGDYIDTVVLTEACRQSFRAFGYYLSGQNRPAGLENLIPVLKSIGIKIKRPLHKKERIIFKKDKYDIVNVGNNNILELKGFITSGDSEQGSFEIQSLLLEAGYISNLREDKKTHVKVSRKQRKAAAKNI